MGYWGRVDCREMLLIVAKLGTVYLYCWKESRTVAWVKGWKEPKRTKFEKNFLFKTLNWNLGILFLLPVCYASEFSVRVGRKEKDNIIGSWRQLKCGCSNLLSRIINFCFRGYQNASQLLCLKTSQYPDCSPSQFFW
jgi:hypothetical protein